jgi:hypothetical protein
MQLMELGPTRSGGNLSTSLKWVAAVLVVTGFVGFFGCFACYLLRNRIPASLELPLGDVGAIAVDGRGTIYCSSQGYGRIQEYASDGRFIRGWPLPYKSPRLEVDELDRLHVAVGYEETVYDRDGRALSHRPCGSRDDKSHSAGPLACKTPSGYAYRARTPNLWPRVVKTDAAGRSTVVVNTPFYLWIIGGPLPGWLRAVAGMILLNAVRRKPRANNASHT